MALIKIKDTDGSWKGLPTLGVQQFPEAPSDGSIYGRKDKNWVKVAAQDKTPAVVIPHTLLTLFLQNVNDFTQVPSADILTALGGQSNWDALLKAAQDKTPIFIESAMIDLSLLILYPLSSYALESSPDGTNIGIYMQIKVDFATEGSGLHYVFDITISYANGVFSLDGAANSKAEGSTALDLDPIFKSDSTIVETVTQDFFNTIRDAYNNKVSLATIPGLGANMPLEITFQDPDYIISFSTIMAHAGVTNVITTYTITFKSDLSVSGGFSTSVLQINGDGDKALMDDGNYKPVFISSPVTTNSLSNLPVDRYSIVVTLSSASALSFASTPEAGWECMIDIKNTSSSTLTLPIPNTGNWQSEDTSMDIAAGKIGCISVRYVHNTYVVIVKGYK